ncbi:Transcriptional regulator, AcrR family [hydrothermal vent metagenome]|uniref:Transcriptional regulator, AcrR family n=1 Tax=hydrothermal vent metagenome TaxID=652676 RepID=A0A3B0WRI5_9ZZZZ
MPSHAHKIHQQKILSRKEREIHEREELILSAAQKMLHQHGYNYLTMDRVAEMVEYSKGTIYNHFASKEDLVCSLCCRCITNLITIFERAYHYPGSTRERYSAIGIGYSLYHQLNPMDAQNIQTVKNNAVREKINDGKLTEMELLEQKITKIARSIVQEAIDCGDLNKQYQQNVNTIVFGCWSMHYGALLLDQSDIPLQELGFSPVVNMLWHNANIYLDGYNWLPLSTTSNTKKLFEKISSALFDDETK